MKKSQPKVIALPISGSMHSIQRHSMKLEYALRDFLTETGAIYYDDNPNSGIISCYYRLENDICIEKRILIREKDYLCYTVLSCHAHPGDSDVITALVIAANDVNYELDYGCFEVNTQTGDIRFRTHYEPGEIIYKEDLDQLTGYPHDAITKYGDRFLKILESSKDDTVAQTEAL